MHRLCLLLPGHSIMKVDAFQNIKRFSARNTRMTLKLFGVFFIYCRFYNSVYMSIKAIQSSVNSFSTLSILEASNKRISFQATPMGDSYSRWFNIKSLGGVWSFNPTQTRFNAHKMAVFCFLFLVVLIHSGVKSRFPLASKCISILSD